MKTNLLVLVFAALLTVSASAQELKVDAPKSVLKWNGKKVGGEHYGKITLKEGSLKVNNDKIENGVFVIDMNT
ncbi:MAG TPA: YceI family protein, partial [Prolixibacteraceae bacterium]|nr:YceI family protein [Prolixibacteraceae bacterium]